MPCGLPADWRGPKKHAAHWGFSRGPAASRGSPRTGGSSSARVSKTVTVNELDKPWAIREIDKFMHSSELVHTPARNRSSSVVSQRDSDAVVAGYAHVVEQILNRVTPDWRSAVSAANERHQWAPLREAAARGKAALEREDDVRLHLGDGAPQHDAGQLSQSVATSPLRRRWDVRQAVLQWLFNEAIRGDEHPALSAEGVALSVHWRGQELTTDEVDRASVWLKNNGLIEGPATWGGGVVRPSLTGKGEVLIESGQAVRDFIAVPGTPGRAVEQAASEDDSVSAAVFLVHGRNSSAKFEVARWLEQSLTADVIILDEQANRGQTIIEKFQAHADAAKFAVVLLTSDDVGGITDSELLPRARQNVIFEMGYFFAKLGRDRVAVLNDGVEQPSDFAGVAYIPFSGNWKEALSRELRAVDFVVKPT